MKNLNLLSSLALIAALSMVEWFHVQKRTAEAEKIKVEAINADLIFTQQALRDQLTLIKDSDTKVVHLSDGVPKVVARVYHNIVREETALDIGSIPPPPPGQYLQFWADIDGKPVSLGMFPLTAPGSWVKMPFFANATGFRVSQSTHPEGDERPLMELMNGLLLIASEPGRGTVAAFTLPRRSSVRVAVPALLQGRGRVLTKLPEKARGLSSMSEKSAAAE